MSTIKFDPDKSAPDPTQSSGGQESSLAPGAIEPDSVAQPIADSAFSLASGDATDTPLPSQSGFGSPINYLTTPLASQSIQPIRLNETFRSGTLIIRALPSVGRAQLRGYQGLFLLVVSLLESDLLSDNRIFLLNNKNAEALQKFIRYFPEDPAAVVGLPIEDLKKFRSTLKKVRNDHGYYKPEHDSRYDLVGGGYIQKFERPQSLAETEVVLTEGQLAADRLGVELDANQISASTLVPDNRPQVFERELGPFKLAYQFYLHLETANRLNFYTLDNIMLFCMQNKHGKTADYYLIHPDKVKDVRHYLDKLIKKHKLVPNREGAYSLAAVKKLDLLINRGVLANVQQNSLFELQSPQNIELNSNAQLVYGEDGAYLRIRDIPAFRAMVFGSSKVSAPRSLDDTIYSKTWFNTQAHNHPGYFEMTDGEGNPQAAILLEAENSPKGYFGIVFLDERGDPLFYHPPLAHRSRSSAYYWEIIRQRDDQGRINNASLYESLWQESEARPLYRGLVEDRLIGSRQVSARVVGDGLLVTHRRLGELEDAEPLFEVHLRPVTQWPTLPEIPTSISTQWHEFRGIGESGVFLFDNFKASFLVGREPHSFVVLVGPYSLVEGHEMYLAIPRPATHANQELFLNFMLKYRQSLRHQSVSSKWQNEGIPLRLYFDQNGKKEIHFDLIPFQATQSMSWGDHQFEVRGESLVLREGDTEKLFELPAFPIGVAKDKKAIPTKVVLSKATNPILEMLQGIESQIKRLNDLRRGLRHLPLDLANWLLRNFTPLQSPFHLKMQVDRLSNGRRTSALGSLRDFKRHNSAQNTYVFKLQWGLDSDEVKYTLTRHGETFLLNPDSKFPFQDPVRISFVKQADDTYQAVLNIDAQSSLMRFLDQSVYGPHLEMTHQDLENDQVEFALSCFNDLDNSLLKKVSDVLSQSSLVKYEAVQPDANGDWRLVFNVAQRDVESISQVWRAIAALYKESVELGREPHWKAPVQEKDTAASVVKSPRPKNEKKSFKIDLPENITLEVVTTQTENISGPSIDQINVYGLKQFRVMHNDEEIHFPLSLEKNAIIVIQGQTANKFVEYHIKLLGDSLGLNAQLIEQKIIPKSDLIKESIVTPDSLVIKAYRDPFTGQRIIHEAYWVLEPDEAVFLAKPSVKLIPIKVSSDLQKLSFNLGKLLGMIDFKLEWHEDDTVTAVRESVDYLMELDADEGVFRIYTDSGEMELALHLDNGRHFLQGSVLKLYLSFLALAKMPISSGVVSLIEVISDGDDVRFNPVSQVGNLIPLTEIKLTSEGMNSVRDALYGPDYLASHGDLPPSGLDIPKVAVSLPLPLTINLAFRPGETLVPTTTTVRMIADAAYQLVTPSGIKQGLSFVEGSPYEYELMAPDSGWVLRIPVLWDPSRPRRPWVLDEARTVLVYQMGQNPLSAQSLSDSRFVAVDNGGDWQLFLLEAGDQGIKRFQINAVVNANAPIFVGGAQVLDKSKQSESNFKQNALTDAGDRRDAFVGRVLSENEIDEEIFQFAKQEIMKGSANSLKLRFQAGPQGKNQWAHMSGIQWDPSNERIIFNGPVTLSIKQNPHDETSIEEINLIAVKMPDENKGIIYFVEYVSNGKFKGRIFEWNMKSGNFQLRYNLRKRISDSEFLTLMRQNNIPLFDESKQVSYRSKTRGFSSSATSIDVNIPILPVKYRGLGYPDPARVNVLKDDALIEILLKQIHDSFVYPTEETLVAQAFVGQKAEEKMIFYGRDMIIEIPMELVGKRYVPSYHTNPDQGLTNIRLLIRNPDLTDAWYDIPAFVHSHRAKGNDPILRFLIGQSQRYFSLIQEFTQQNLGTRSVFGLRTDILDNDHSAFRRSRAHLVDYLEFMDMDKKTTPIRPVDFKLGESIRLPDGRVLNLKVVQKGKRFRLEGYKLISDESGAAHAAVEIFENQSGRKNDWLQLYRAAHGNPLYYLKDKQGQFLLMVLDEEGQPMFWERKEGIKEFPTANRSEFEMVGLRSQAYRSGATSTAMSLWLEPSLEEPGVRKFKTIVALGRQKGASETSTLVAGGSKALVRFSGSFDAQGDWHLYPKSQIKKEGRGESWQDANFEWFQEATGKLKLFFKRTFEDGYHDYAWVEFENAAHLAGKNFRVSKAHYNRTNWQDSHIMPEDAGFLSLLFGALEVYPPYAALAENLNEQDRSELSQLTAGSKGDYAVVQAMLNGLGIEPSHPHWDLYFSSFLYKDSSDRNEMKLFDWPERVRLNLIEFFNQKQNATQKLGRLLQLAFYKAPLSLDDAAQVRAHVLNESGTDQLLDTLKGDLELWCGALINFNRARELHAKGISDKAVEKAILAGEAFDLLEDTQGSRQNADWLTEFYSEPEIERMPPQPLKVRAGLPAVKPAASIVPIEMAQVVGSSELDFDSVVRQPFFPGVALPKWLLGVVHKAMVFKTMESGYSFKGSQPLSGALETNSKNYVSVSIQRGLIMGHLSQGNLETITKFEVSDMDSLFADLHSIFSSFASLDLSDRVFKRKIASHLYVLWQTFGFWVPQSIKFHKEAVSEERFKEFIENYLDEPTILADLLPAAQKHLNDVVALKTQWQTTQQPPAVIAERGPNYVPPTKYTRKVANRAPYFNPDNPDTAALAKPRDPKDPQSSAFFGAPPIADDLGVLGALALKPDLMLNPEPTRIIEQASNSDHLKISNYDPLNLSNILQQSTFTYYRPALLPGWGVLNPASSFSGLTFARTFL